MRLPAIIIRAKWTFFIALIFSFAIIYYCEFNATSFLSAVAPEERSTQHELDVSATFNTRTNAPPTSSDSTFFRVVTPEESNKQQGLDDTTTTFNASTKIVTSEKSNDASPTSNTDAFPSEVFIEIVNIKGPYNLYKYSVTIESHGKYTGTAMLLTIIENESEQPRTGDSLLFSWEPSFPGEYEIFVHEIKATRKHNKTTTTPLLKPSPLTISITDGGNDQQEFFSSFVGSGIENAIPCQMVEKANVYSKLNGGSWIGPNVPYGGDRIRTGWTYIPSKEMGCFLETFSRRDLLSLDKKKSIHILGTSRERGVFLSLVDLLLSKEEKENLDQSVIGKCWGRASVKKGNLELMYQDFRVQFFEPRSTPKYMECHNNKISKEPGALFIENAFLIWEEIFQEEESWPSVILMLTNYLKPRFDFDYHIQSFVYNLPPTWNGTLILTDDYFSAMRGGLVDIQKYEYYLDRIERFVRRLKDKRVRWIDGIGISSQMRMHAEKGPEHVAGSQHFHRTCNVPYFDAFEANPMRVCSNITEVLGQILLGHTLGPKQSFMREQLQNPQDLTLSYCHACPENLLPFHLTPHPNMTCAEGPLNLRDQNEIYEEEDTKKSNNKTCPKHCLEQPVSERMTSQSDVIKIRRCNV